MEVNKYIGSKHRFSGRDMTLGKEFKDNSSLDALVMVPRLCVEAWS